MWGQHIALTMTKLEGKFEVPRRDCCEINPKNYAHKKVTFMSRYRVTFGKKHQWLLLTCLHRIAIYFMLRS